MIAQSCSVFSFPVEMDVSVVKVINLKRQRLFVSNSVYSYVNLYN